MASATYCPYPMTQADGAATIWSIAGHHGRGSRSMANHILACKASAREVARITPAHIMFSSNFKGAGEWGPTMCPEGLELFGGPH